jgi:hypothetical protein
MQERIFVHLTDASGGDLWLDVDRIVAVRDSAQGTFVHLFGLEIAALVVETAAEVIDRVERAVKAAAELRR